jgi:hypothetical protein
MAELLPIKEVLSSVSSGNRKAAICSDFVLLKEPSDGLEPSTPSLPWRSWGGTGVHGGAREITFFLQTGISNLVDGARACPHVLSLMYPSRTRGMLSVLTTDDAHG